MAKTVFLNNYGGLSFGYEVDTTVVFAELIIVPGDPEAEPPIPDEIIGVKVYPASMSTIQTNMLLEIGGVGEVVVTGGGSDEEGDFFTYSETLVPGAGAFIRTPWSWIGNLLYAQESNSVSLSYYLPTEHDLYFRTQKTPDSGSIQVLLDGESLGTFDLSHTENLLVSVLLKADVVSGPHTVHVTALVGTPNFVYFHSFEMLEHVVETGGEYLYLGPAGTLEDSPNNFLGQWGTVAGYAYTTDPTARVFFYPQLETDGQVKVRLQKTPDSAIVAVYVNDAWQQDIDLYADPGVNPFEVLLLDNNAGDPAGLYQVELRHTDTRNPASSGNLIYFKSAVVVFSRTDQQALTLAANYLKQVAAIRGDGAFLDAWDSTLINFDANALYACMGLLAAYRALGQSAYLDAVRNFLNWLAQRQVSAPGVEFDDGAWYIGYEVNPSPPPTYRSAVGPYAQQGISEIKWVDAVQCLPAFVLWWYWRLSGDTTTRDALLPVFQKAIDGFIANNYDPETAFFFSSWQNKTAPTIFLYHDAIRRYGAGGAMLEQHNDAAEGFFTYSGAWSSYAPQGAIGSDEHYTLTSQSYVEFSLPLNGGDQVRWVTQTAWDVGIAEVLVSTEGSNFSPAGTLDGYSPSLLLQQEFLLYTAPSSGTYWFRLRHSGTINPAGNIVPGWQRLASRFAAGQVDIVLGLSGLWLLTRQTKYAHLAARVIRRFAGSFWKAAAGSEPFGRWYISLDGAPPGIGNPFWYPMAYGYTVFGYQPTRFIQPTRHFAEGLEALEGYQDAEGGFQPPGYVEPEHIFSAFYLLGENQLASPTNPQAYELAKGFLKSGQYLLSLGGEQVGGMVFSKRYQYLYTNISGFACLALAGAIGDGSAGKNPLTEQLRFSESRMVMRQ
ncbi:MAG: hypothetical protein HY647_02630 [Acidobacteria bacterium]|nr:hypothetical protein [Acidobacteriota bacterium]